MMRGYNSASPFGMMGPFGAPEGTPPIAPTQPAAPFTWGAGGAQMSPEALALEHERAAQMMNAGMDTSPVGHLTQGLARVGQALAGNVIEGRAQKGDAANERARTAIIASLTGGSPEPGAVAQALGSSDAAVREFGSDVWKAQNRPAPQATEFERSLLDSGVARGSPEWAAAQRRRVDNALDPFVNTQLPGGGFYSGPRSIFEQQMGGGDPASTAPASGAPPPGAAEPFADAAQAGALIQSMGAKGFLDWQGKHGTGVKVNSPEEMARLPAGTKVISPDGRVGIKR